MAQKTIIVVGAGIIGASFALHAAEAGANVLLLDARDQPGGLATAKSWAWINASWGNAQNYVRLRMEAMRRWRALDAAVPGLTVNWCGSLLWDLPPDQLRAFVKEHTAWGYDIRLVDGAEAQRLEPHLAQAPALAAHAPGEGTVEPVHAVEKLIAAAQAKGARLLPGVLARWLVQANGQVTGVMTADGVLEADEVVLAAGTGVPDLLQPLGLDLALDAPPGLLSYSEPAPELLRGVVLSLELHVRQTAEGRLVAGTDFAGADPGADPDAAAAALHAKVQQLIRGADAVPLAFHTVGQRPTPRDGVSAIGRPEGWAGLYVCVSHSGITLAPALGALGVAELMDGVRDPLLAPFHPQRLLAAR